MKCRSLIFVAALFLFFFRHANAQTIADTKGVYNEALADELARMAEVDQIAAWIPKGKYKEWSNGRWAAFKDSVFTTHKVRLQDILDRFGYPGYNLVGKKGEKHFWLMVQHCDRHPEFQERVLEKLKIEVRNKNADAKNFGLLTDRVKINSGEGQIYGTQVRYNAVGQAYPKPLADSLNVNRRRAEVGLEPLQQYLNVMTQMHFEMNKENLQKKGITEPQLYRTD
ncbi:MAG TPA: DUF6624 domain-containing protein [Chryseosolibacter sp.]|nr:DUF6624 domain-containing protein [Chryseosolibacter sp.]